MPRCDYMSRYRQMRKKLRKGLAQPDVEGLSVDDPRQRGGAARSCCPCRVGWSAYQANRDELEHLCKDEDATVRFNALHVRQDAFLAQALADRHDSTRQATAAREAREKTKTRDRQREDTRNRKRRSPSP